MAINFTNNEISLKREIILWTLLFFVASSTIGAANVTVSEVFPCQYRSKSLSIMYTISLTIGGVIPNLFLYFT